MKILQICAAYKPAYIYGGPTMSVSMLSEQLVKKDIEVEVFATTANGLSELPVVPNERVLVENVPVTYFERKTKDHTHFSSALLKALWKSDGKFTVIHIHAWWNLVSVLSCAIALMCGSTVLVSPRGTLSPYSFQNKNIGVKWFLHHLLGKHLLNRCAIHVTSERERDAVLTLIRPKSITLLPNFIKLPIKTVVKHAGQSAVFKLLFFSRLEEKKGLDLLIRALAAVTVPYNLTIAGDGNSEYVESLKILAITLGVNDRINWIGFYNGDKFNLLSSHDLFILPSHDENFGNAVIESLSAGTPVLISEQVGLAGYVTQNNLGWICKTNEVSISKAINNIANNYRTDGIRIRNDAPDLINKDFNEDNLVRRYITIYQQLTNK